ncbi:MAG TPA: sigma-70 family RNA polymerase sigma factor [Trebonia sp.]|nr:sigma-70 family RNA polymerase sigma factor [Trebonia sp.]
MRTPAGADPGLATVVAAQRGDRDALDALAAGYLPLVYNIVGRAMNGHPDVDDVVQETMLRAVRGVGELRDPAAFRSWLVAIAIRQVRDSYRDRLAQPPAAEFDAPAPDFADQTIDRLGLSGQRLQTAEATRWLDEDDRPVLALWWQEAAGQLSRAELAAGLGLTPAHAAVRVARMKERLVTSRMIVHALRRFPPCGDIAAITAGWDAEPSPLWRKRLARHVRDCQWCLSGTADMIPAERLLSGLPLLAVPAGLAGRALSQVSGGAFAHPGTAGHAGRHAQVNGVRGLRAARHARVLSKSAVTVQPKLIAVSLAVATCAAGGTFAVAHAHAHRAPAGAAISAPASASSLAVPPAPLATHSAHLRQPVKPPVKPPAKKPSPAPPPATATSQRKGVGTWNFAGVEQAIADSGASWYYNWGATPNGISAPANASYVPMIWGPASVTAATLAQVSGEGHVLLGFNEPDLGSQSNMTVARALDLWPRLMATGMTLGSPAVASGAATPGGWLDQFMAGARQRGYRVNFIAVHWYGGDFAAGPAVQQLESYLQAIYARYHLPVWLTEFALTSYSGGTATFPTEAQQAAFLTAATKMLDGLPYVQRYAWFALPTSSGSGTTGLFNPGPSVTQVGQAFEEAR